MVIRLFKIERILGLSMLLEMLFNTKTNGKKDIEIDL